jgi:iron complex outermembrane receptor protein
MKKPLLAGLVFPLASTLFVIPAFAEDANIPTLSTIVVTGEAASPFDGLGNSNEKSGTLTAPGIGEVRNDLAKMPGAVGVVAASQFKDRYAANLEDIFALTPGVFAQKRYGQEVRLSIRGAGLSRGYHLRGIELLENGIPLNDADGSGDFQEVDPLILQHIEVYRGGDGLQYGAASLGGAINMVTPTAHTAQAENLSRLDGGSFGTLRMHGEVSRVLGNVDFFASTTGLTSDGYREHSKENTARFAGNLGVHLDQNAETRFYLNYNSVDQELPGTVSLDAALHSPEAASASALSGDQQRNSRSVRFANKTSFSIGDNGLLDVGAYVGYHSLFHPIYQVLDQGSSNVGVFTRYTDEAQLFGHRNVMTAGFRYGYTDLTGNNYVNAGGQRGSLLQESTQISTTATLYAENAFYVVRGVAIVTGLQGVQATRDYETTIAASGVQKSDDADFSSLSPKLGLLWDIAPAMQAYANVTRTYEPPIMSDLTQTLGAGTQFTPMDPQRALTYEVGTRGTSRLVAWDVAVYRARVEDELVNFTTGVGVPASTFNARRTLHQGVEAALSLDLGKLMLNNLVPQDDLLTLEQSYTWSDARFDGDAVYGDNQLAGSVPHVYSAALRYRSASGWDVAPKIDWVPQGGYVDYANTQKVAGYALIGIEAGIDLVPGVRLFAEGRNLADRNAVTSYTTVATYTPGDEIFYPVEGRAIFAGITATF